MALVRPPDCAAELCGAPHGCQRRDCRAGATVAPDTSPPPLAALPPGCGIVGCRGACATGGACAIPAEGRALRLEAIAAAALRRLRGPTLADTVAASIDLRRLLTGDEREAAEVAAWHARHAAGAASACPDAPEPAEGATVAPDTSPPPSPASAPLTSQVAPTLRARKPRAPAARADAPGLFDWTPSPDELAARARPPAPKPPPKPEPDAIACAECRERDPCQFPACLPPHLRPPAPEGATVAPDTSPPPPAEPEGPPVLAADLARPFAALEAALTRELGAGARVRVDPYSADRACVGATLAPGRRLVTSAARPTLIRPAVTLAAEIAAELRAWRPPGAEAPTLPTPETPHGLPELPYCRHLHLPGSGPRDDDAARDAA